MDERTRDDALPARVAEATKLYLDPVQDEDWFNVIVTLVRAECAEKDAAVAALREQALTSERRRLEHVDDLRAGEATNRRLRDENEQLTAEVAAWRRADVTDHTGSPQWRSGYRVVDGRTMEVVEGLVSRARYDQLCEALGREHQPHFLVGGRYVRGNSCPDCALVIGGVP